MWAFAAQVHNNGKKNKKHRLESTPSREPRLQSEKVELSQAASGKSCSLVSRLTVSRVAATLVISERPNIQVFQDWKFFVYGCDKLLQIPIRHQEADPVYAIMVLEGKHDLFFIFCSDGATSVNVINYKWKGRQMCQHVCYRCAICIQERKPKVGCRPKYEVSPSSADMHELVPPVFMAPFSPF